MKIIENNPLKNNNIFLTRKKSLEMALEIHKEKVDSSATILNTANEIYNWFVKPEQESALMMLLKKLPLDNTIIHQEESTLSYQELLQTPPKQISTPEVLSHFFSIRLNTLNERGEIIKPIEVLQYFQNLLLELQKAHISLHHKQNKFYHDLFHLCQDQKSDL